MPTIAVALAPAPSELELACRPDWVAEAGEPLDEPLEVMVLMPEEPDMLPEDMPVMLAEEESVMLAELAEEPVRNLVSRDSSCCAYVAYQSWRPSQSRWQNSRSRQWSRPESG